MSGATKLMTASGGGVILTPASAIASDVTVNIPSANCTVLTTTSAGTVLQVVQGTYSTAASTTSASFSDTGLTATITPTSATSKIFVVFNNLMSGTGTSETQVHVKYLRDATVIGNYNASYIDMYVNTSTNMQLEFPTSFSYLDSPATTSAITYKMQFNKAVGTTAYAQFDNQMATVILMEIAA